MRSSREEAYVRAVSCSCLTRSSNSVGRAGADGMGHPQLGFPRLRFVTGRAGGITIGPDHTPSWVTARQNRRTGGAWFAGAGGAVIFSAYGSFGGDAAHGLRACDAVGD